MKPPLLYFLENISSGNKRHVFSFREVSVWRGRKFCVMTYENHEAIVFEIKTDKFNNWKIIKPVPDWVISLEKKLIETLNARVI